MRADALFTWFGNRAGLNLVGLAGFDSVAEMKGNAL
jgi:hypothetical protein